MTHTIQCPDCRGSGAVTGLACGPSGGSVRTLRCFTCHGDTTITTQKSEWMRQGEAIRTDRIREHCGAKERAWMLGLTRLQLNAVEHGKVDPMEVLA